jgi:hypothetical protein
LGGRFGATVRFTVDERDELVRLCDAAINSYLQKRGAAVYDPKNSGAGAAMMRIEAASSLSALLVQ